MTTYTASGSASPITITGVRSGSYNVSITAHNSAGNSVASTSAGVTVLSANRPWLAGYAGGDNTQSGHAAYNTNHGITIGAYGTWDDSYNSWAVADSAYGPSGFLSPVKLNPQDNSHITIIAPGLIPNSGGAMNHSALASAAAGNDLSQWQTIGQGLLSGGWNSWSTVMRIGHEMNGNWEPWGTWDSTLNGGNGGTNATYEANFASAFRYAVQGIRQYCPLIRFDLCFSSGYYSDANTLTNHYPGDAYVDIISVDFYDGFATGSLYTGSADFLQAMSYLNFANVSAFAHSHSKLFAVDEWGLNGSLSGHDNPNFVQQMFNNLNLVGTNYPGIVSHDCYFDVNAGGAGNWAANPNAAARYSTLWSS